MRRTLIYFAMKYQGDWNSIYRAIQRKEKPSEEEISQLLSTLRSEVVTILDKEYPLNFGRVYRPPFVLFYQGNIKLLYGNIISIVGSRETPKYANDSLKKIIKEMDSSLIICSGLARGIDTIALEEGLNNNLDVIAFLPCGINDCYPKENYSLYNKIIEKGLVCSEYPFNMKVKRDNFYMRNRLIAGACTKLIIAHVRKRSGTMITLNYALEFGKEIYCIPSRIDDDSYTNEIIKDGAELLLSGKDLL